VEEVERFSTAEELRRRIDKLHVQVEELSDSPQLVYHPLFDADEQDTASQDASPVEDPTARLVLRNEGVAGKVRFECNELQKELKTNEDFEYLDRMQRFEPLQVTAKRNVEWWWFEDRFYRVGFEEGQPSAELAKVSSLGEGYNPKQSLDRFRKVGYTPDEIAESVFEARGKKENGFERAIRADEAKAIHDQWIAIGIEEIDLARREPSRNEKLRHDPSAKILARGTDTSAQVSFESSIHQPPLALPINKEQLDLASELQNYHPLLVTRFVGQGRSEGSEAVAEWWWFKGSFYIAKQRRGYQSDVLTKVAEQHTLTRDELSRPRRGWAKARIPKLAVGEVTEDVYEGGYAPEEVARLVFALQGRQERTGEKFDRIRAAKDLLNHTPVCDELWEEETDGFYRNRYEKYLQARTDGYKGDFKQWNWEQDRELLRYLDATMPTDSTGFGREYASQQARNRMLEEVVGRDIGLDDVNYMEGWEFERYMVDILGRSGYSVESTRLSGDQGVDMLLEMEDRKIAVQLKRYARPVGNKAVQEVLAGRVHYAAQEAWVITTSSFTRSAMELARSTGVRLIDGHELREWLSELNSE